MCKLQKELADLEIQIQNLKNQQVDLAIAVAGKEQIHKLIQSAISEIGSERIRNLFLSELRDLGIIAEPEQPSDDDTEEEIEQHEELLGRMCDYLEGKIEPLDSDDEEDDDGWEEFQAFTPDEEIINENEISATAENEFVKIRSRVTGDEFTVPILRSNEIWIWTENPKPDGLFDE